MQEWGKAKTLCAVWIGLVSAGASASATALDHTEKVMGDYRRDGIEELRRFEAAGTAARLHLTRRAGVILTARSFDVPDEQFDREVFLKFIVDRFTATFAYFRKLLPASGVAEVHLVLDDLGENRKESVSMAWVGARVVTLDVRRWHKLHRGYRSYLADVTSIHELTHVHNYFADPKETQYHRELAAIVVESLILVHKHGAPTYKKNYLRKVAGKLARRDHVLGERYRGNAPLRYLAHSFLTKTLEGVYPAPGDRMALLETFARLYLDDPGIGAAGFASAARAAHLLDGKGRPLELARVQADLFAELPAPPPAPPPNPRKGS